VKAQNVIKLLMCSHYNNFNTETKFITEKIESYINKDNTFPDKIKVDITMKNENDYLKELRKIGTERINRYDIYMIEDRYITDYLPYISNLNGALLRSDVELNPIIEKSFIQDCMRYSRLYNKTTLKCMVNIIYNDIYDLKYLNDLNLFLFYSIYTLPLYFYYLFYFILFNMLFTFIF